MNQPPHSKFHRVLCVALVVLLVAAVVGAPESFATTKDIEDAAVPTAASIYTSSEESAGDGGCSADEYLVDAVLFALYNLFSTPGSIHHRLCLCQKR